MVCALKQAREFSRIRRTDLEALTARREVFPVATCYDSTTARWMFRGGIQVLIVGDSAAQLVLGLEPGEAAPVDFMAMLTGAVRRGAPEAYVIGDLPRGAADTSVDTALENARRLVQEGADAVKLEVTEAHGTIVSALAQAGIDTVAHLQHRTDGVRCTGQAEHASALTSCAINRLVKTGIAMIEAGASMLLLEAIDKAASERILQVLRERSPLLPILGCDAGPHCDGQVRVLHELLGLSGQGGEQSGLGHQIQATATLWVEQLRSSAARVEGNTTGQQM